MIPASAHLTGEPAVHWQRMPLLIAGREMAKPGGDNINNKAAGEFTIRQFEKEFAGVCS